jgi:hypothetical protein
MPYDIKRMATRMGVGIAVPDTDYVAPKLVIDMCSPTAQKKHRSGSQDDKKLSANTKPRSMKRKVPMPVPLADKKIAGAGRTKYKFAYLKKSKTPCHTICTLFVCCAGTCTNMILRT